MCGTDGAGVDGAAVRGARRSSRRAPAGRGDGGRRTVPQAVCGRGASSSTSTRSTAPSWLRDLPPAGRAGEGRRSAGDGGMTAARAIAGRGRQAHPDHRRRVRDRDPELEAVARPTMPATLGLAHDQKGNNDILALTKPEVPETIHRAYFEAGADIVVDQHLLAPTGSARPITAPSIWCARSTSRARSIARRLADEYRGEGRPPALRRRRDRADQQDAVAVARRQRSGLSRDRLRLSEGRLPRADRRAGRGRGRLHPDRDGVRHAERQGRGDGGDRGGRGAGPRPADHAVDDADRSVGAQPVGAYGRGVLARGAPCAGR